jgi:hypothetical protein
MKPEHLALPVVALAVAGILLGMQRKSVPGLRGENGQLHERISEARVAAAPSNSVRPARPHPRGNAIDWEKLAGFIRENPQSQAPEMLSMQRRLLAMDKSELLAALDHIAAMDLDDATRERLETMILDQLCKKDPEAALERFKGTLRNEFGQQTALLFSAFEVWTRQDPAAVAVWLDREIAAGTFEAHSLDGNHSVRVMFESVVVFGLFAEDPAKAEARLSKLPQKMRADILRLADLSHEMGAGDEIAYAEIVRRQLDEKGRVAAIAERARKTLGNGGDFAAVDEYLNSVYAAPDERERAAGVVARQHTRNLALKHELNVAKIEEMREWVGRDAPELVGRMTGEALGAGVNFGDGMVFAAASELALHYRENDGNDDALHAFLSKLDPKTNPAEARKLAELISDPAKREKLLGKFE